MSFQKDLDKYIEQLNLRVQGKSGENAQSFSETPKRLVYESAQKAHKENRKLSARQILNQKQKSLNRFQKDLHEAAMAELMPKQRQKVKQGKTDIQIVEGE